MTSSRLPQDAMPSASITEMPREQDAGIKRAPGVQGVMTGMKVTDRAANPGRGILKPELLQVHVWSQMNGPGHLQMPWGLPSQAKWL